ncbi:uncharacterized protein LOC111711258, partial [Eurytemora carolleeae]|uniref:uncharacterized protein LOC111711258 n=1 Tax=Eurytemora carolleeae TaxID=1294199 RepID=UPI000C785F4B
MGEVSNRFSMRSLRASLASDTMAPRLSRVRQEESVTAYTAVPKQVLNLVDVQIKSADTSNRTMLRTVTTFKHETSRERKRRRWKEKMKNYSEQTKSTKNKVEGWAYLPDLILEQIFQYLTYKV